MLKHLKKIMPRKAKSAQPTKDKVVNDPDILSEMMAAFKIITTDSEFTDLENASNDKDQLRKAFTLLARRIDEIDPNVRIKIDNIRRNREFKKNKR